MYLSRIYIPLNKRKTKFTAFIQFGMYCSVSFFGALILVILTIQKGLPGMPSYFIQGYTECTYKIINRDIFSKLIICFNSLMIINLTLHTKKISHPRIAAILYTTCVFNIAFEFLHNGRCLLWLSKIQLQRYCSKF